MAIAGAEQRLVRMLEYALLYPFSTAVFSAVKASNLLTVWSFWPLDIIMTTLIAFSFLQWHQNRRLVWEGHFFSWFFSTFGSLGFASLIVALGPVTYLPPLIYLPYFVLIYTLQFANLLLKTPHPYKQLMISWHWSIYSVIAGLISSMVFSLKIDMLTLFLFAWIIGWYHDIISRKLVHFYLRLFFWLGLFFGMIAVVTVLLPMLVSTIDVNSILLFLLALPVMLHAKGDYLLRTGGYQLLETDEYEKMEAAQLEKHKIKRPRSRIRLLWNLSFSLGVVMIIPGLYYTAISDYNVAFSFIFPGSVGIIYALFLYGKQRRKHGS